MQENAGIAGAGDYPPAAMPSPPCRSLARLRGPLLWAALAAHAAGCGGPTGRDPVPHRGVPPGPVTTRQTSAQGLRVDRTRRPQGSLAVLLAVLPTEIAARPTRRAELSARALRLATGLAPIGGHAVAETLGGAPSIRIEAPVSRLADAALTLASELELPPPPPGAGVWVLGDALDALGALGAPDPQAPPVGRPYLVIVDTAESGGRDDRDAIDRLLKALAALPERRRQAVLLRLDADLSHADIGAVLGTTQAAARQLVYEAQKALRLALSGREEAP